MRVLSKISKILAVTGLCTAIAGCAIRPLPGDRPFFPIATDDPTETPTFAIVQHIRCEARHAIAKTTMDSISKELNKLAKFSTDTSSRQFLASITNSAGELSFDLLVGAVGDNNYYLEKERKFNPVFANFLGTGDRDEVLNDIKVVEAFATSGVGFDFTLTGTEDNNASSGMLNSDFPQNFGNLGLGLGGSYTRQRKNVRELKIVETIHSIVFDRDLIEIGFCNEHDFDVNRKKNYSYPIAGRIGLDDSFSTFANLVLKSTFGNRDVKKGFEGKTTLAELSSQDLTDTITFTTTIEGTANPSLQLNPLLTSANLSLASIQLSNKRMDQHELRLIIQETNVAEILDKLEADSLRDDGVGLVSFGAK